MFDAGTHSNWSCSARNVTQTNWFFNFPRRIVTAALASVGAASSTAVSTPTEPRTSIPWRL